jgi:ParB family transcriptional regulator, chromosome partitioning protein
MTQLQKRRLGRGLAALIGDDTSEEAVTEDVRALRHIPVELIHSNPNNPRKTFKEDELEDLAKSIREKGILQPLVVRPKGERHYEIVAGERRWRAAQRAGVHDVPALIRELSDGEALEIALVENVQRSDLNAVEEARGFAQLVEQFGYTQQQLADAIGKSRSHISNTLRLLTLPEQVRQQIEAGVLTAGHARALVATDAPEALAEKIVKLGMTVRETENLVRPADAPRRKPPKNGAAKSADTFALEKQLSSAIGLQVEIRPRGGEAGEVTIAYTTLDQLDDVIRRLSRG